jgi:ribonucleoside-diphosphate reductase alpha chain
MITQISKRDGRVVPFDPSKIVTVVRRAFETVSEGSPDLAAEIAREVVDALEARFPSSGLVRGEHDARSPLPPPPPGLSVENVQDAVEEALVRRALPKSAKHYILYRYQHAAIRSAKALVGVSDELKLTVNAVQVLKKRYLMRNDRGEVVETPDGLLRRVAHAVAAAEPAAEAPAMEQAFYEVMSALDFLPNSPTLMNAGTLAGQLSACFVLPVEDSISGIFEAVNAMALVHKWGGGTGFSFSRLRPRGDLVAQTGELASGPLAFMKVFDITSEVIRQGGRRRGANMAVLRCDHPDILAFITAKDRSGELTNFNLSVGITDEFMAALERDEPYALRNPRGGAPVGKLDAREVFRMIVTQAWRTGDPGLIFLDAMNRANPTPHVGSFETTNPCGEQPLLPWESCNLGSINLKHMVTDGRLDRERLIHTVEIGVRFLDDVVDVNRWPLEPIRTLSRANRKIGLGVMGFADALLLLGVPYASEEALRVGEEIGELIQRESHRVSTRLAEVRGTFPNYRGSVWDQAGVPMRNATTTTIAPTGSISIIAGCSSGIEPLFAISYIRTAIEGGRLLETNPIFEEVARRRGFHSDELLRTIARCGTVRDLPAVPEDVRRLFATALDIDPEWHVRMQAAFQRHCDNAVSKTINFPAHASLQDVERAFRLAHEMGCKGITVYRYGSKAEQVLYLGGDPHAPLLNRQELTTVDAEYSGGCPDGQCPT